MKSIKVLGLAAIAAAALLTFGGTGSASATELTCNGAKCAVGAIFHADSNGHTVLHPPIGAIECNATIRGEVTNAGSPTSTATGQITAFIFTGCTNGATFAVLKPGTLQFHSTGGGNSTLTWTGMEMTTVLAGFHCIFSTTNTDIGTVTTNTASGGNAKLDISATLARTGGSSGIFCGATAAWTGSFVFNTPASLIIH